MKRFTANIGFDHKEIGKLNKVLLQEGFHNRLNEVRRVNLSVTQKPTSTELIIPFVSNQGNSTLNNLEQIAGYNLDPLKGNSVAKDICFGGYDESKIKFLSLEGEAHIITHAMNYYFDEDNIPMCKVTFYFYTRSKNIVEKSKFIKFTDDIISQSNLDYVLDRNGLIEDYSLSNSVLFIDGPLIGGNITHYNINLIKKLHEKNILPVFIVKNSDSNLITDNINNLRNEFNSDLHWAYKLLNRGQRSCLFEYIDRHNPKFSKIFCYFKPFDFITPQRIEIHPSTFNLFQDLSEDLFNLIYYLLLLHGDKTNPQMRPIAIAEMYAREVMRSINIELLLRRSSLTQTMNQSRFGG